MPVDLGSYLKQRGSPLAGHMKELYAAANRYRIDPRLIVAIAGGETSFGTAGGGPKNFNAWGIGPGIEYKSWAEGLNAAAKLLRTGYVGQGLNSLAKIQSKWAPIGATNDPTSLNSNWMMNIGRIYSDLGGNPNNVMAGWRKQSAPGAPRPVAPPPSVRPQTGTPVAMSPMSIDFSKIDLGVPSPTDVAAENLADIAAGKSAVSGLTKLSEGMTAYRTAKSTYADMIAATEAQAAATRQVAPDGKQAPKNKDGGTYVTTPTTETATTGKGTDPRVMKAIQIAKQQIGKPYIWGAESPKEGGFDCSGLLDFAFRQAGIDIGPSRLTTSATEGAIKLGRSVKGGAMQPGDWLITNRGNHIVMYIGGGQVIAAPHSGTNVQLQPVSRFKGQIVDVRRVR